MPIGPQTGHPLSVFALLFTLLVVSLEEVADLVDDLGRHHSADDSDGQARRTGGDGGAHSGPGPAVPPSWWCESRL